MGLDEETKREVLTSRKKSERREGSGVRRGREKGEGRCRERRGRRRRRRRRRERRE